MRQGEVHEHAGSRAQGQLAGCGGGQGRQGHAAGSSRRAAAGELCCCRAPTPHACLARPRVRLCQHDRSLAASLVRILSTTNCGTRPSCTTRPARATTRTTCRSTRTRPSWCAHGVVAGADSAARRATELAPDPSRISRTSSSSCSQDECQIADSESQFIKRSDCDTIFIVCNFQPDKKSPEAAVNLETAMMRYEFLESIVRAAIAKYGRGQATEDVADSVRQLMERNIVANLPPGAPVGWRCLSMPGRQACGAWWPPWTSPHTSPFALCPLHLQRRATCPTSSATTASTARRWTCCSSGTRCGVQRPSAGLPAACASGPPATPVQRLLDW